MQSGKTVEQILAGCEVQGMSDETYEDARLHKDIGVGKYIHKYIVKPIAQKGSSSVLRAHILKAVGDVVGKSVIDVSTGDDTTILTIADKAKYVLANDISIHSMLPVIQKSNHDNLFFRHENFVTMKHPQIDVVVCKNTLHHLNTISQIKKALTKLSRLGKKIVIMDVENPKLSPLARAWNAYYVFMLKDQGGFFISFNQFQAVLKAVYKGRSIRTQKIKTIKGTYMLAVVS